MILQSLSLSLSTPMVSLPPSAAAVAAALVNSVRLGLDRRLYANASRQYLTKLKVKTGGRIPLKHCPFHRRLFSRRALAQFVSAVRTLCLRD